MPMLSTTAWVVHDVGLAAAIGGTIFGRAALQPGLRKISNASDRDLVSDEAWRRFAWINLAAHGAFATTWFIGRSMLTGREVSARARKLTQVKDALVIASLVTGVASTVSGRILGARSRQHLGPAEVEQEAVPGSLGGGDGQRTREIRKTRAVTRTVGTLGVLNLLANIGIAAVTVALSMQASESLRFAAKSRRLP